MFISALGSITGKSNRLGFKKASKAIVILVDGLGSENLRAAAGHAPFLSAKLRASKSINTVFPSTTAAAITSFGVGAPPSSHGIFGYSVFERATGQVRNLLTGWGSDFKTSEYQSHPSVSSMAIQSGVRSFTVGPGEYAESGFTNLNMKGADYVAARSFDDRINATLEIVRAKQSSLTYLYFPELDSIAHAHGCESTEWLNKLEDLEAAIKALVTSLPVDVGVVLTADHGIIDVPRENQVLLDELGITDLVAVTGDPRNCFLYFTPGSNLEKLATEISEKIGERVLVATLQDLKVAGWFDGQVANEQLAPDLFLISVARTACYHRGFAKPQSLKMVGQHGGISQTELSVPLLKFGAFAD